MFYAYILLIMAITIALAYLGATIYRRYKDNQLSDMYIDNTAEDLIGDEWKNEEQVAAEPELCGFQPDNKGYLPCKRIDGHDGPCAHDLKPAHEGNEVITLGLARKKFEDFKKSVARDPLMCINHTGDDRRWGESCDCEVEAHNQAYDMLTEWLKNKETRTFGNQVCDPLASIGRKVKVEPKKKENTWTPPPKPDYQPLLPLELLTFCGNNKLQIEDVVRLAKSAMEDKETEKLPIADQIRKNAIEKERAKWLEEVRAIEAKVKAEKEDDAFHLKVIADEKARLEGEVASLKKLLAELQATPPVIVPHVSVDGISVPSSFSVTRVRSGGVVTQTGVRKTKRKFKKTSKRKK